MDLDIPHHSPNPSIYRGVLEFGRFSREFKRINGLAHRNKRFVPQRMEMSTKRLFHYKQEMRAFDW